MATLRIPSIIETMETGVVAATEQNLGPEAALWRIEFQHDGAERATCNGVERAMVPVAFLTESRAIVQGYVQACAAVA